jgi:N-acyl-D-amino-acid deacylase
MASVDSVVTSLMRRYEMPGASIAVVKDGRLVYARGFGWSDVEARTPVQPTDLFRIASASKPITAAAIMKLIEDGKLHLTDRALDYVRDLAPPRGVRSDPRLEQITIEMLLQHTAGWNRDQTFDPMDLPGLAASVVGTPAPASAETIARWVFRQPLQTDPGTAYSYSNFGYSLLGRIIERVSGQTYQQYVQDAILGPAGVSDMRLGRTRLWERAPGDVKYYAIGGEAFDSRMERSVFPDDGVVPRAYGWFHLEAMDSYGGWIASAADLAKFITAVDGLPTRPDVLSAESIRQMVAVPRVGPLADAARFVWTLRSAGVRSEGAIPDSIRLLATQFSGAYWYGNGWYVRSAGGNASWWHDGSLPGSTTLIVRVSNGLGWVALFNARAKDDGFANALDRGMWTAVGGVTAWPTSDLFARYR